MTTIAAPAHHHLLRNTLIFLLLLVAACCGMWKGAGMLMHHWNTPRTSVSYTMTDTEAQILRGAWHTPATMGDFRAKADIAGGNVVSVIQAVN